MRNGYQYPMLYTLEGSRLGASSISKVTVLGELDNYDTVGGWKMPEWLKKTGTFLKNQVKNVAELGKYAPVVGQFIEMGLDVYDLGNGLFRVKEKDGSEKIISGETGEVVKEKTNKNFLAPIAIGAAGLIAAFGILS